MLLVFIMFTDLTSSELRFGKRDNMHAVFLNRKSSILLSYTRVLHRHTPEPPPIYRHVVRVKFRT